MDYQTIESGAYLDQIQTQINEHNWSGMEIGKVIAEHRDSYLLRNSEGTEYRAELLGQLTYAAESRLDLPAVGDWVPFVAFDEDLAIIHGVLPRKSLLERTHTGKKKDNQIIATNIDTGLIVMGADRDFNLNRMERYVTLCHSSGIVPCVVLTKADLLEEQEYTDLIGLLKERLDETTFFAISSVTGLGVEALKKHLEPGQTYCLLGSSGAGKSTLINTLSEQELMKTGAISSHVNKGKHTTTHRELLELPNGAYIIDNPGMREVGIGSAGEGLGETFESIEELAQGCRFTDCKHLNEPGCQVLEALTDGRVSPEAYDNFQKLARETEHYESTEAERRKKGKALAGLVKSMKKKR